MRLVFISAQTHIGCFTLVATHLYLFPHLHCSLWFRSLSPPPCRSLFVCLPLNSFSRLSPTFTFPPCFPTENPPPPLSSGESTWQTNTETAFPLFWKCAVEGENERTSVVVVFLPYFLLSHSFWGKKLWNCGETMEFYLIWLSFSLFQVPYPEPEWENLQSPQSFAFLLQTKGKERKGESGSRIKHTLPRSVVSCP